jgi:anti-sigma B factor antagonist
MARLTIKNDQPRRGVVCVALSGELDMSSAYCMDAELRRLEQTRPEMLIVDLRDLAFMDSSGLARLLAAHRRARNGGWRFGLIRGPAAVERMLRLAATEEHFLTLPDPAAAPA